jgi:hypothetical protein
LRGVDTLHPMHLSGYCISETDFRTENRERFFDLHLPVMPTIALSLDVYVEEQELKDDNKYFTDYYGLQEANKGTAEAS